MQEKQRPKVGVGIVVIGDGKVLLGKRKGSHGEGSFAFPGGHLEMGETLEQCTVRELAEETGLKPLSIQEGPWTNDIMEDSKHYVTIFAFVDRFEGKLELLEPHKCEGWQWYDWDKLPSPLFPSVATVVEKMKLAETKKISSYSVFPQKNMDTLLIKILSFYQERDWEKFHSPKNLVMDLGSEIGELLDHYRWLTEEQSYIHDEKALSEIRDEIADIFIVLIYLAHKIGVHPIDASFDKLLKIEKKYPVDLCRGKALKYTAYENP